jgi:hypothetical protein
MGNEDKNGNLKPARRAIQSYRRFSFRCRENSMLVSFGARCSGGEISNAPGLCSFRENINVSDGFWGMTKNSVFNLWYENNVELYMPVDAPRKPRRKSGEAEDDWKQRVTMYKAKLTNWSTKIEEAKQKYRQMQNKAYVSFDEGQA